MRVQPQQDAQQFTLDIAGVLSFCFRVGYAMRFEIAFIASLGLLWMMGILKRTKTKGESLPLRKGRHPQLPRERPQPTMSPKATRGRTPEVGAEVDATARAIRDIADLTQDSARLRDSAWLFPRLVQLCSSQAQRAVAVYRSALKAGLDLSKEPVAERDQLVMALVTSMIRLGQVDQATQLLQDLSSRGIGASAALRVSVVKLCTSKHCFSDCLMIHDLLSECEDSEVLDKTVWSCLLFCAVESHSYSRCPQFFNKLKALGAPSHKDYWHMVRYCSTLGDWKMILRLINEMRELKLEIDSVIYNTSLATCVANERIEEAHQLLDDMDKIGGVADVITYNTLMKGYSKAGKMVECFKVYELLRDRGLTPSQVTFGVLLDGCISNNQIDEAAKVFDIMTKDGCPMNTVLYTTLIKGFARDGKVDEAMRVYAQMGSDRHVQPDLITFSILLKVNCDAGRLEVALTLLDTVLKSGLRPDEVIFNNLLAGCAKVGNAPLAKRLYSDMVAAGVRPSNATFSILIRVYSQCKLLDEALEMLQSEPAKYKVEVEARLFSQLIQSCIRARQGRRAAEVYQLMIEHGNASASMHSSMLGMCVKLNMFDTASELLEIAAANGGHVDARDANILLQGVQRKQKAAVADSILASMSKMKLPVER